MALSRSSRSGMLEGPLELGRRNSPVSFAAAFGEAAAAGRRFVLSPLCWRGVPPARSSACRACTAQQKREGRPEQQSIQREMMKELAAPSSSSSAAPADAAGAGITPGCGVGLLGDMVAGTVEAGAAPARTTRRMHRATQMTALVRFAVRIVSVPPAISIRCITAAFLVKLR